VRVIKLREIRKGRYTMHVGKTGSVKNILVRKPHGKRSPGKLRRRGEDDIKIHGASSGSGWRRPPVVVSSYEYNEQAVMYSRRGVVLQLGGWARG